MSTVSYNKSFVSFELHVRVHLCGRVSETEPYTSSPADGCFHSSRTHSCPGEPEHCAWCLCVLARKWLMSLQFIVWYSHAALNYQSWKYRRFKDMDTRQYIALPASGVHRTKSALMVLRAPSVEKHHPHITLSFKTALPFYVFIKDAVN